MKLVFILLISSQILACASSSISKNLSSLAFDEKAQTTELHSIGNIDGKDCTWYVMGYGVGEDPTVRSAFTNAMNQQEGSLIPGQAAKSKGTPLLAVKNVSVHESGFNAYLASRRCVVVTGVGLQ